MRPSVLAPLFLFVWAQVAQFSMAQPNSDSWACALNLNTAVFVKQAEIKQRGTPATIAETEFLDTSQLAVITAVIADITSNYPNLLRDQSSFDLAVEKSIKHLNAATAHRVRSYDPFDAQDYETVMENASECLRS